MSAAKNTGGPAFPVPTGALWNGITVRDYFAIRALREASSLYPNGHERGWRGIARVAYEIADEMLAARDGK